MGKVLHHYLFYYKFLQVYMEYKCSMWDIKDTAVSFVIFHIDVYINWSGANQGIIFINV